MSLTGNLETMPLPDILQFLGLGRKTGVLSIDSPIGKKLLVVEGGEAIFCSSNGPKEYLGAHLLARTPLKEADLERAFRLQRESGRRLGEVLVDHVPCSSRQTCCGTRGAEVVGSNYSHL